MTSAVEVCARSCTNDNHHAAMLTGLLRAPCLSTVAVIEGKIVGVCIASRVRDVRTETAAAQDLASSGFIDLLAVDPKWQGCGVGAQLLEHAESQLADTCRHVHVGGNAPFYAWPGVDARYTRAIGLFEDHGYRRRSIEMTMSVDLTTAPLDTSADEVRLARLGFSFRRASLDEMPAMLTALARAWKSQWLDELDAAVRQPHGGVVIAASRDGYAGFCAFGVNRPAEVGPLGTDPTRRRQGIGTVLVRSAMRAVAADGHLVGELPWAGPLSLFARTLDARVTRIFVTYRKQLA